ncbi:MAG: MerR family transcriptional regulator [Acidobacteriaceae bacterium]
MTFILDQYLREWLDVSDEDLRFLEDTNVLNPVRKDGRIFFSDKDVYRARGILHFMRAENLPFEDAVLRLDGVSAREVKK